MSSSVFSIIEHGTSGIIVAIECHLSNNLPTIVIVGSANRAVDESRERVRGAFSSSGIAMPRKRITINLAPADIPKVSSGFDLPIAAAIMIASQSTDVAQAKSKVKSSNQIFNNRCALMGELGLDGMVRPVRGIIGKILAGRKHGIDTFYIPTANIDQAQLVPGVRLIAISNLKLLAAFMAGETQPTVIDTSQSVTSALNDSGPADYELSFEDIIGQLQAKRACVIAAAGGHNILLNGPPGTGKSMLARALPSILPCLNPEEMLEVTHLHSLAGKQYQQIITSRPFRSPHHSASQVAIVGGGNLLRPGEISLAHHGVLFFDEFPEFKHTTIEALRQPLEDRRITISRARDSMEYPASFILVATANPCPCGYYGFTSGIKHCECSNAAIQNYRARLSGPILDRIDLHCQVNEVDHTHLLGNMTTTQVQTASDIRDQIDRARNVQQSRNGSNRLNAMLSNRELNRYANLQPAAKQLLDSASGSLKLSARAYMRTVKVARTIADLAQQQSVDTDHISEALQYRSRASG